MTHVDASIELPYHQWKSFQANLDWVTNAMTEKKRISYHNTLSPHYIATWVRQGSVQKRHGNQSLSARSGEWVFQQPGENITTTASEGTQYIETGFSIEWAGDGHLYIPSKPLFWKTKSPLPELETKTIRMYQYIRNQGPKVAWDYNMRTTKTHMGLYLYYHHLFYDWLTTWEKCIREHGRGWLHARDIDEKMINAVRYLEEHPIHLPISVSGMARELGLSTVHCIHLFRQTYHTTPKAYRMSLKLKRALHDLETTRKEIKEIATSLGYSQSWFSIWIKRETGLTPREVRANKGVFHQN